MAEVHTFYLIHPLEVRDGPIDYVDGYNDDHQAVRLAFEVGSGKWQAEDAPVSFVYVTDDTRVSIPQTNVALIEVYET